MTAEDPQQPGRHLNGAMATNHGGSPVEISMANGHHIVADQPVYQQGTDEGPTPIDLMLASLCACKVSVMRTYADRKQYPMDSVTVSARWRRVSATEEGEDGTELIDVMDCDIALVGDLSDEQRIRIHAASSACPVQRVFAGVTRVKTNLTNEPVPPVA